MLGVVGAAELLDFGQAVFLRLSDGPCAPRKVWDLSRSQCSIRMCLPLSFHVVAGYEVSQ